MRSIVSICLIEDYYQQMIPGGQPPSQFMPANSQHPMASNPYQMPPNPWEWYNFYPPHFDKYENLN